MLSDHDWRQVQALMDIEHALSALAFFVEVPDESTILERRKFRCFHDSAVVSYCRPFTQSKGLPKLSLGKMGVKLDKNERALHERLMQYRNKVAAHTDGDRMRLLQTSFPLSGGMNFPHIVQDEGFEFYDDCDQLERLFSKVLHALATFVFDLVQDQPASTKNRRDYLA